jgi:hypothetical protein
LTTTHFLEEVMKVPFSLLVLAAAVAFTVPSFAADAPAVPMTKADCAKAKDMKWDAVSMKCLESSASTGASEGTSGKTSDRTPGNASPDRTPGATDSGAAGTDAGQTPDGTSDRTPNK